jgi:hypothetical protein
MIVEGFVLTIPDQGYDRPLAVVTDPAETKIWLGTIPGAKVKGVPLNPPLAELIRQHRVTR